MHKGMVNHVKDSPRKRVKKKKKHKKKHSRLQTVPPSAAISPMPQQHYQSLKIHGVQVDTKSVLGLRGMSEKHEILLTYSGISKEVVLKHPEEVFNLLEFHIKGPQTNKELKKELKSAAKIRKTNPRKYFTIMSKIGEGGVGQVYKVENKETRRKLAAKICKSSEKKAITQEIKLQALSKHPNIVEYIETFFYKKELWIVLELMTGSLTSILEETMEIEWSENDIIFVINQVLKGLAYLHSQNRIHRDIKSDNILVDLKGNVKIGDLGSAASLTTEKQKRKTVVGTPYWMAPEIIKRLPYGPKADIWSVGIVIFEICENEPPFFEMEPLQALLSISVSPAPRLKEPENYSKEFCHLLETMVERDVGIRASADLGLMHLAFKKRIGTKSEFSGFLRSVKERRDTIDGDSIL